MPLQYQRRPADLLTALEKVPGLYMLVLSPDFTVLAATDAYISALQLEKDSVIGGKLFEVFFHEPFAAGAGVIKLKDSLLKAISQKVPDEAGTQTVHILNNRTGRFDVRYWKITNSPMVNAAGNVECVLHKVDDLTELLITEQENETLRKQVAEVERTLRHERTMHEEMEAMAHVGRFELLLPGNELHWSEELYRIYGIPSGSQRMTSEQFFKLVHPEDLAIVNEGIDRLKNGDEPVRMEHRFVSQPGVFGRVQVNARRVFDEDANGYRISGIVRDITGQKRAEAALKESKDQLQSVFDVSPNAISVFKCVREDQGLITDFEWILCNERARKLTKNEDLIGRRLTDLFPRLADSDVFFHFSQVVEQGGPAEFQLSCSSDEGARWLRILAVKLGDGLVALAEDISNRKTAEEELQKSERLLRSMIDTLPHITWTGHPDGRMLFHNARWYEYTGLSAAEGRDWLWEQVVHPEDFQRTHEAWKRSLETGNIYQNLYRLKNAEGEYRWHIARAEPIKDDHDEIVLWVGTSTNIHDRISAEEELRKSNEQFRTLVENIPDVITRWNKNLEPLFANADLREEAADSFFRRPERQYLNGGREEQWKGWADKVQAVFESGKAQDFYLSYPSPLGIDYYYIRLVPEFSEQGAVESVLSISRDISKIKQLEQEYLEFKLSQQKKLLWTVLEGLEEQRRRAAEQLMAVVKNLLEPGDTSLRQLRDEASALPSNPNETHEGTLQLLQRAVQQTEMISGELYPHGLEELGLRGAMEDLCKKMETPGTRVQSSVQYPDRLLPFPLELVVYRMAAELIRNGIDHGQAASISVLLQADTTAIRLTVEDDGEVIDQELSEKKKGGLTQIQNYATLLNGSIRIDSSEKYGTKVEVTFPITTGFMHPWE